MRSWLLLLALFCLVTNDVRASESEFADRILLGDSLPIDVAPFTTYFEDETGALTFEEANRKNFKALPEGEIRFGYTRSRFWLRFGLSNQNDKAEEVILRTYVNFFRPLEIYQRTDEGDFKSVLYSDVKVPFGSRPEGIRHLAHEFEIPAGGTVDFYVHFGARGLASLPMEITKRELIRSEQKEATIKIVIFLAIIGTLIISNLFYFTAIRAWAYLLYVSQEFIAALYVVHMDGFTFQYLWPDNPELNTNATSFLGSFSLFFVAWFSISFLRSREYAPRYHRFLVGLTVLLGVFSFVVIFIETGIANQIVQILPFALTLGIMPLAIYVVWRGHLAARYFLVGWGVFYFLIGYFSIATLGLTDTTDSPWDFLYSPMDIVRLAIVFEAVILSLGLADQYRRLNDDFKKSQIELVDQLQARLEESRERVRLEQEKESALKQVFEKSKLLAGTSHDIAQPLRSLRLALASATENIANPKVVDSVSSTLDDMEAVIGEALHEASGALKDASDDVSADVENILSVVAGSFRDEIVNKGLFIRVFSPQLEISVSTVSLKRCLTNLVSNAVQYTQEGGILIAARRRGKGVLVQIFDTGPGLSETEQVELFGLLRRSEGSTGYGMGLPIVREICDASA